MNVTSGVGYCWELGLRALSSLQPDTLQRELGHVFESVVIEI